MNYRTIYSIQAYIGTAISSGETPTWTYSELAAGIENMSEALNEVVQQYQFLSGEGFAQNHVTGMAPVFSFSGKRVVGDAAQDYIFGKKYSMDSNRSTSIKVTYSVPGGSTSTTTTITCNATLCNVQEISGGATDDTAISFELRFDGAPTVTTA